MFKKILLLLFLINQCDAGEVYLDKIHLPPGFKISIFAPVPNARSLALGDQGTIFVATKEKGKIFAVVNDEANHTKKVILIAKNLNVPNGVAFANGNLYVAERNKIISFKDIENHLDQISPPETIYAQLPNESHHGWRYISIGPDQKLYISIGAPCNVCVSQEKIFATIMRMNLDGSQAEIYAEGVRNAMGFDWQPETKTLWFTDNGRDWLGDNLPPDELNRVDQPGSHFGFPFCYGKNVLDRDFDPKASCEKFIPSAFDLPAHVAALGMRFYSGQQFPQEYQNNIFIALHGSWNRTKKIGYEVVRVKLNGKQVVGIEPFASGWLSEGKVWGRPVDLLVLKDGSLIVSDDKASLLYQITFTK